MSKPRTDWAASANGVRFHPAGRSRGGPTNAPMGGERVKAPPVWKRRRAASVHPQRMKMEGTRLATGRGRLQSADQLRLQARNDQRRSAPARSFRRSLTHAAFLRTHENKHRLIFGVDSFA